MAYYTNYDLIWSNLISPLCADIRSRFVKIAAHIATSTIPTRLLPYTRLFLKAIFSLPVDKNGSLVSYEDVVKGLSEDTLEYDASLGTSSGFRELAVFTLKAKVGRSPPLHFTLLMTISSSFYY